ncbi:MAG: hypothetical protein LBM38_04400 [Clostridiales bacterium]|jgi:hypothetical protein|nr:hypothetical protein [Clostridiales bacterium]
MKNVTILREVPQCKLCVNSTKIPFGNNVLCKHHGVVTCDFCCKKFELNIMSGNQSHRRKHLHKLNNIKVPCEIV